MHRNDPEQEAERQMARDDEYYGCISSQDGSTYAGKGGSLVQFHSLPPSPLQQGLDSFVIQRHHVVQELGVLGVAALLRQGTIDFRPGGPADGSSVASCCPDLCSMVLFFTLVVVKLWLLKPGIRPVQLHSHCGTPISV